MRSYRLGLENDLPVFTALWRPEEEFRMGDFVVLLCEIPPGGTASSRVSKCATVAPFVLIHFATVIMNENPRPAPQTGAVTVFARPINAGMARAYGAALEGALSLRAVTLLSF